MPASDRNWQIDGDPFTVTEEDLQAAVMEGAIVVKNIGGALVIGAERHEIAPDHYVTTAYRFRWTSFMPATRLPKDEPVQEVPEPDPQPEPVPEPDPIPA